MKMNHNDALHILGLTAKALPTDIKAAYRRASSQYHPDRNPAGLEMMKLVNAAYAALDEVITGGRFDSSVQHEKEGAETYGEDLNTALNAIIALGLEIEVCGSWIWVSGDTRPHREILKASGYKWAPKKTMWHFRPAEYKSFNRGKWDMDKIRATHGSTVIKPKSYQRLEDRA